MVTGVSIRSFQSDGWYDHGETIDVRVTFNKVVTVTGSPRLALAIGSTTRQAAYRAASGASVDFRYTVADPDHDTDGLSIAAGALTLNGGAISHGGVAAALGLGSHALGAQASHKVDGPRRPRDGRLHHVEPGEQRRLRRGRDHRSGSIFQRQRRQHAKAPAGADRLQTGADHRRQHRATPRSRRRTSPAGGTTGACHTDTRSRRRIGTRTASPSRRTR